MKNDFFVKFSKISDIFVLAGIYIFENKLPAI